MTILVHRNEGDAKNEDDVKKKDNLKNEDNPKNEENLKMMTIDNVDVLAKFGWPQQWRLLRQSQKWRQT